MRRAALVPIDSAEVGYNAMVPEKPEHGLVALVAGKANDFSYVVDRVGVSAIASESCYVREGAAVPEKGVEDRVSREVHGAGHLTKVIKTRHKTKRASEVANVHHFAVVP